LKSKKKLFIRFIITTSNTMSVLSNSTASWRMCVIYTSKGVMKILGCPLSIEKSWCPQNWDFDADGWNNSNPLKTLFVNYFEMTVKNLRSTYTSQLRLKQVALWSLKPIMFGLYFIFWMLHYVNYWVWIPE
jgi:hypothetical protein